MDVLTWIGQRLLQYWNEVSKVKMYQEMTWGQWWLGWLFIIACISLVKIFIVPVIYGETKDKINKGIYNIKDKMRKNASDNKMVATRREMINRMRR